MKGKILKVSVIIILILAMTMANFVFVGNSLISYALDNISTNNNNIEFGAYFKDANGEKITNLEKGINSSDINLYLYVKVKNQGYFNGEISLYKANFKLKEIENEYINKIEGNVITLNQINAEKEIELEIPVEFTKTEIFDLSLLNMESEIKLKGIYRDSSEKDKEIKANKTVTLKIVPENASSDNIENSAKIITNKTLQVAGKNKRVVQVLVNTGLKDNSYPVKEININTNVPDMDSKQPEVSVAVNFNTMTKYEYNYENKQININFKNDKTDEGYIRWKNSGNESIVLTYLYDEQNIENIVLNGKIDLTLYDGTKIETNIEDINVNKDEEKEEIITAKLEENETIMYKGKLYQGIDRDYTSKESISVNTANIVNYIEIKEEDVFETQAQETIANTVYRRTTINKEQLFNVLGENGTIIIKNTEGKFVETITKDTETDENGNIVINYGENGQKGIVIRTTTPVKAGNIDITHDKTIKQNDQKLIKDSISFNTKLFVSTNLNEGEQAPKQISKIELKEATTSATLEINKTELSTVIGNDVELKAILKSKSEANDLYKNPVLNIEFPEEVENITINDISIVYDDELKIKNYNLNGRVLTIAIEGEQTHYSESAIEGANVIVNGKITLNKKAATKDTQIIMSYSNEKATSYENEAKAVTNVKVVSPTDVTTVTTIEQLGVEEVNQEGTKEVILQRGTEAKEITPQIEIINNKENTITDVKVLGTFPTGESENSIGIDITSPISVENSKVYYSENENATDDLSNEENGWSESIQDPSTVEKYLIVADEVSSQDSIVATYNAVIPANLEYNENAIQNYQVTYTDSESNFSDTVQATRLRMTTGVGPQLKATLTAKVGKDELKDGDQVKSGEVIKYHIEVSNTGTEIAKNITLSSPIPEGTTLVEAKANYEYTGASYYTEVGKDDCKEEIEQLNVGETIVREYEVRVDKDITDGDIATNKATVKFDDVTTESNELKSTLKSGNIRVSVKRVTDKRITLTNGSSVVYYAIVENTTSETIDNVKIKTDLSNVKVESLKVISGQIDRDISDDDLIDIGDEPKTVNDNQEQTNNNEVTSEELEYSQEVNIGSIPAGKNKILKYSCVIEDQNKIELSVKAIQGQNQYRSNVWKDTVKEEKITMNMTTTSSNRYVKDGDIIEYVINIVNDGDIDLNTILIKDLIPIDLTIRNVEVNNEKVDLPEDNYVREFINLAKGEQASIKVVAAIDDIEDRAEATEISNKAVAVYRGEEIASTNEVTHIIQPDEGISDNGNTDSDNKDDGNNNDNDIKDNNIAEGTKLISGTAWYDENANGKKDDNEKALSGITVKLLNAETNKFVKDKSGNNITATTKENGTYILSNIGNGKYIVVFDYNSTTYGLTKYRATGVDETVNSNAMMNEISIDGTNKKVASTDIIQISNNNISDVNIGLIKLQNFDLKLEKFVNRILIQNSAGTTVREYNNSTLAKVELDSKQINNTTVIVEYKIRITNVGEVEGYVKKVADYIPSDLKFSSELNKDWYQSGAQLYNASLANDKIAAGESKELSLTLTKTMTENNVGLINNMAEITEAYNELGLSDSNSTPGNKTKGENDMGSADLVISIKTGEIIFYTTMSIILAIVVLSGIAIPLVKKSKKEKTRHKFDKI